MDNSGRNNVVYSLMQRDGNNYSRIRRHRLPMEKFNRLKVAAFSVVYDGVQRMDENRTDLRSRRHVDLAGPTHTSCVSDVRSTTRDVIQNLTLTSELGLGVTPGARLTRVVSCAKEVQTTDGRREHRPTRKPKINIILQQIGAICETILPNCLELRMTGPTPDPTTPDQSPSLQDQILNHISSLETLIKQRNEKVRTLITPICLTFGEEGDRNKGKDKGKGPVEEVDDDLKKPYKEVLKSPFTRMFQQTLDGLARGWFDRMPNGCIDSWADLHEKFVERFALRRRSNKDPTEVSKIVWRANETLPNFKERWTEQTGYIQGVPDVEDFVKSEEAYKSTELTKGEHPENGQGTPYRGPRPPRIMQSGGPPKVDGYNTYNQRDHYQPYVSPRQQGRRNENLDRYCDYHGEKGHYTNDYYQLKRQLEAALESGKLNHLGDSRKRKFQKKREEGWMNAPITFPPIPFDDVSDEPLIIEAEVEGYLVRKVFVDQGATTQVMFEHSFRNLCLTIQARLTQTHTEAMPENEDEIHGNASVIPIFSTTHVMMKFPIPRGIATLVAWMAAIFKCRQLEGKQVLPEEQPTERTMESGESSTEEDLINLLKDNKDVFTWQPADIVGVPRRISQHSLNVSPSITPVVQKRMVLGPEKSKVVMKEVVEWIKAGIMRPVLLSDLRIAGKMKVQALKVKVDSKLVACQMNGEFVGSSDGMAKYLAKQKSSRLFTRSSQLKMCLEIKIKRGTARSVVAKIMRQGYYWPSMHRDRPILEGPGRLKFIIMAIDYFTKWIEAKPLAETTRKLKNSFGKTLCSGRERVGSVDKLPNILWAHQTMLKTSNGETSFSLTYGSEAVIPAEIGMPTYRTIQWNKAQNEDEMRLNLVLIQESRETAKIREAKYKKKVEQ
nr:hypothetical protein [Tanacetum cinerariifolium]